MERREIDDVRDPADGDGMPMNRRVVEDASAPEPGSEVVSTFNPGWRAVQLVYLVFGVIDGLIIIRVILKLLGANAHAAFASWLYSFTAFFLSPFHNLLPTIGTEQSQLELSSLIAILVYGLAGWALARLATVVFFKRVTVARRGSGALRPRGY